MRGPVADSSSREEPPALLFGTKIHAPPLRPGMIDRPELLASLGSHRGPALVVAPPGFGKTKLLTQWNERDDRPFAWVSLDGGDSDPVTLWTYITGAIRAVEPQFGQKDEALQRAPRGDIMTSYLPRVLNELDSVEKDIVLVLDDYHWIRDATCHRSLDIFLEREPINVAVVVSTRSDPPLHLGRLRVGGDLVELRAAELSFSDEETSRLLNDELGLDLTPQAIGALHERTEGWPAGLYLAYLSLRHAPDRERLVADFGGSNRQVTDYLTEVVMSTLDEGTRDFLLKTSILDRMCGPLCDAVTGRGDSAKLLADLERANHFIIPLDERREWYRYHHLFAELLHDELRRREAERVPELHRLASEWLGARGYTGEAIRHAIAAGEAEWGARLVASHYLTSVERGGLARVAGWLESFPREAITQDARLSIVEAWLMIFMNRPQDARAAMENALAVGYDGPLPDGASSVESSAALLRAGFPDGDVREMLAAARRAFELEGRGESMWRVTVHVQLGWALALNGAFEEARPYLERAAALAPPDEQWMNARGSALLLAWLCLELGDEEEAERWARVGLEVEQAHDLAEAAPVGWGPATLGAVLARRGQIQEADRFLTQGIAGMHTLSEPLLLAQALLAFAPVRRALGDTRGARGLLAEARGLLEPCKEPGVLGDRLTEVGHGLASADRRNGGGDRLTEREVQVLRLLASGLSKREVGGELFLSYNTIHSHTRSIYQKLGASSRAEAIERAQEQGLL